MVTKGIGKAEVGVVTTAKTDRPKDVHDVIQRMIRFAQDKAIKESARNAELGIKDERGETLMVSRAKYFDTLVEDGIAVGILKLSEEELDMFAEQMGLPKSNFSSRTQFVDILNQAGYKVSYEVSPTETEGRLEGGFQIAVDNLEPVLDAKGKAIANQYRVLRPEPSETALAEKDSFRPEPSETALAEKDSFKRVSGLKVDFFAPLEEYLLRKEEEDKAKQPQGPQNFFLSLEEYLGLAPKKEEKAEEK